MICCGNFIIIYKVIFVGNHFRIAWTQRLAFSSCCVRFALPPYRLSVPESRRNNGNNSNNNKEWISTCDESRQRLLCTRTTAFGLLHHPNRWNGTSSTIETIIFAIPAIQGPMWVIDWFPWRQQSRSRRKIRPIITIMAHWQWHRSQTIVEEPVYIQDALQTVLSTARQIDDEME